MDNCRLILGEETSKSKVTKTVVLFSEKIVGLRAQRVLGVYANRVGPNDPQGDSNKMLKKIAFIAVLALQLAAVTSVASADLPFPTCGPCPGDTTTPPAR
jgi:hypothetical protein